jgi:hypothetical protein
MITKINNKVLAGVFALLFPLSSLFFTSCEKFFEQDSDDVLYADKDHLNNAVDTVYSVVGIMNKLQAIADRTILLGEVRGDLIDLTSTASSDLRDLATFNVGDDNVYNAPRDYYAVINNCNYFIANANTALKSNRDEFIFMKEYAAVKAIRAWTYLQLVINYGRVPFVTEPVLSKEDAERQYEMYDIEAVCRYFLNDLASIPELYNTSYPAYRTIRSTDSRYFFFPLSIIRGELNLWLGSVTQNKEFYRQAALNYYKYISQRNGTGTAYPIGLSLRMWRPGSSSWTATQSVNINEAFNAESESSSNYTTKELITMIPGDSIRAEGNYSELRNLFNSTEDNQYKPSLTPSQAIQDISAAQVNCCLSTVRSDGSVSVAYAPQGLSKHQSGDLRLSNVWSEGYAFNTVSSELVETQSILKYQTRNVHIYRRQMVYLRMAEALNQAGYPRMAFQMLAQGVNNKVKNDTIYKFYSENDSLFLAQFDFPETLYGLFTVSDVVSSTFLASHNTIGIHTRGSGWTPRNEYYVMPDDTTITDPEARLARQIAGVDSLILNESALEFAFEGTRYYDVMRYAMRQSNPGEAMAKIIYGRRGESRRAEMQGTIKKDLNNKANWFLNWNGKIGF